MNDDKSKKKLVIICTLIFICIVIGITYALQMTSLLVTTSTAVVKVDEDAYGDTNLDTSNLDLIPILDSNIYTNTSNVLKIDFTVGGSNENTREDVIYDIALVDLQVNCDLLSEYVKWKLVKNGEELSSGNLSYTFDTIVDGRLVLTNIQQDLPVYNANQEGYDEYSFYLWISDPCQDGLSDCYTNKNMVDTSTLMGKELSGAIEVELYTDSKRELVRKPSDTLNEDTCIKSLVLSDMEIGSYVNYVGNNNCLEGHCDGTNANYVDDNNMGYCNSETYKYKVNGFRIMAKDEGGVYIISAGAVECLCTNSNGTFSNNSCTSYISDNVNNSTHIDKLNSIAITYCNKNYAKNGVCNNTTAWAMSNLDFQRITESTLSTCHSSSKVSCGKDNTLIDNGGYYWYTELYSNSLLLSWNPRYQYVTYNYSRYPYGVRPVLYLEPDILIVGGTGIYGDPYQLSN